MATIIRVGLLWRFFWNLEKLMDLGSYLENLDKYIYPMISQSSIKEVS